MKTDSLFYRLFQEWPQLALELLGLPYRSESYRFVSEEIKQTSFRIDGLFKPTEPNPEQPLIFAEVQYQPDNDFYGRFFSEIALYCYRQKPARHWLALVIYPNRAVEKSASIEFKPFMDLPQLQRIYLEDYQDRPALTPALSLIQLIACEPQQTINLAQTLTKQRELLSADALNFIETVLVYKLPHLSREDIKTMLALNDIELKQTRFYKEIAEEERQEGMQKGMQKGIQKGRQEGRQEECITLVMRLLIRRVGIHPELDQASSHFQIMSVEQLETLAEALLDFNDISDLTKWLQNQPHKNA